MNEEKARLRTAIVRIGMYSLAVNLVLVAAKLTLSLITGSLALRADAIHSLVDVFASIALILGLVISGRKSRNFPLGLYKVENLVSAIISLLLFLTAYEIVTEAIHGRTAGSYGSWVLGVVAILILVPFFFGRYELSAGRKYNSPSLIADGSQFRADVLGSSIVFIGLLGQLFGFPLDRIAAGIIALFIAYAAWGLLASSMRVLLDASVSSEVLEKVRSLIQAEPSVSAVQNLVGRNSGRFIFVQATITMRTTDLRKAHMVSEKIEQAIKNAVPNIDRVVIHYEPETKVQKRYAVTLSDREGQISEDFGKSPYFAMVDIDTREKTVIRQEVVANPYHEVEKGRGIEVADFLLTYKPDIVVAREVLVGKGPGYVLADTGAETLQTEAKSLDELLSQLMGGQIEKYPRDTLKHCCTNSW
jgi:cation diffusion facilitator family transporter